MNAKREKIMKERGIDPIALPPREPVEQRESRDDRKLEEQG